MIRQANLVLFFILTVASRVYAQDSSSVAKSISSALRAKQYEQALQLAKSALARSPKDLRILTMEGIALAGLGKQREALAAYNTALQISPDYVPALEGAAELEYRAGSERAIPLLNRLLKLNPHDPTSHAMLAVFAYKRHDCETAAKHFRESSELIDTQPAALQEYGACLVDLKQFEDAIHVFQQLVALSPEDFHARFNLAVVQFSAQHSKDAIDTLQPLLEAKDPDPDALDLGSAAYEDTGDTPRAVSLVRQAIILNPQNPKYYLDFATLSFDHSSYQVGIDMLNVGVTKLPKSAPLYIARGILYVQLAEYDKGDADFETADRLDPTQAFGSQGLGVTRAEQNKLDEGLATVRSQLKSHPDDAFLHYLVAEMLTQNGAAVGTPDFQEALKSVSRAVQLKPDLVLAHDLLGRLYLKSGQTDKAIEQSRLAVRAAPSDQAALYHLIQALRKSDKKGEIPGLLKRLADAREEARKQEGSRNRYKLVELPPVQAQGETPPQ